MFNVLSDFGLYYLYTTVQMFGVCKFFACLFLKEVSYAYQGCNQKHFFYQK